MTYRDCYERGHEILSAVGVEEADLDARLLLEYVCHTDRNALLAHGDREVTEEENARFGELIARRAEHIPLQYLTGEQEFMGLNFRVDEHVLIPRQDTEILVEEVLRELHDGMRILDICTGSGCILISLMKYSNDCEGVGVDISEEALRVAGQNAESILGGDANLKWIRGDLFEGVAGKYEFIVSNPPYIRRGDMDSLMPEVREHEPALALDGGEDGLDFYRAITEKCGDHLVNGGMLYLEIGCDQADDVVELMQRAGFEDVYVVRDYSGLDRVVYGRWRIS